MVAHEARCFTRAARLRPEDLVTHSAHSPRPTVGELRAFDAIFFGGSGAFGVYDDLPWIRNGLRVITEVIDAGVPAFASCFGFQGLAQVLGGEVTHDPATTEMGSTRVALTEAGRRDPLFSFLPPQLWVQEGHHDRVTRVPPGVITLASSALCPEQAFRVEGAPFWASQFHPELSLRGTLDRFEHYASHYLEDTAALERLREHLAQGLETPEVSELLARVARGQF